MAIYYNAGFIPSYYGDVAYFELIRDLKDINLNYLLDIIKTKSTIIKNIVICDVNRCVLLEYDVEKDCPFFTPKNNDVRGLLDEIRNIFVKCETSKPTNCPNC